MAASLIRGRAVITKALDDDRVELVPDGAVYQAGGRIVEIGPYVALKRKYDAVETIGSADHVVIPGLVNAHHHVGLTPFQLGTPDLPLELWLTARLGARAIDPYLDTLYSAIEMVGSGVTTVQHLDMMCPGGPGAWTERAQAVIRAYRDIGMRTSYALSIRDQNRIVYGPDEAFCKTLPTALARKVEAWLAASGFAAEEFEAAFLEPLYEAQGRNRDPWVRIWLAPINLERCSDPLLLRCKAWAARYGMGIHLHLSETAHQKLYAQRQFGTTALGHLDEIGFLGPEVTLGHGVWITEADIERMRAAKVVLCHNASSNLRLGSGIAPVVSALGRGIPVALGIDEAGLNDDRDMLQEMRLAANLHRIAGPWERRPSAAQVFRMATETGAHATGFGDRIGSLELGKSADLVLLDYAAIAAPHLDPDVPILDAVIHRAKSVHVDTVMIAGNPVLRHGRFTTIDRDAVIEALSESLRAPLTPEERARRRLAKALFPHVRRFYDDWPIDNGTPFYQPNSRT